MLLLFCVKSDISNSSLDINIHIIQCRNSMSSVFHMLSILTIYKVVWTLQLAPIHLYHKLFKYIIITEVIV